MNFVTRDFEVGIIKLLVCVAPSHRKAHSDV